MSYRLMFWILIGVGFVYLLYGFVKGKIYIGSDLEKYNKADAGILVQFWNR